MKRLLYLIIYMCSLSSSLSAQESDSLLTVLRNIEQSQSEYTIDIISDGLEELKAPTTKADGLDAVKAVMRACKRLPVKVKVHGKHIYVQHEGMKVVRKRITKAERAAEEQRRFELKQQKKKERKRGH